jgi:hypothetical protein
LRALPRRPQESNPEVIREVSVGHSEKRRRDPLGARSVRVVRRDSKRKKKKKEKRESGNAENTGKRKKRRRSELSRDFSCPFSANFRPVRHKSARRGKKVRTRVTRKKKRKRTRKNAREEKSPKWSMEAERGSRTGEPRVSDRQAKLA